MDNLEIICPVTNKTFQATLLIDDVIAFSCRDASVAVWCLHCERSHLVPAESLVRGLHRETRLADAAGSGPSGCHQTIEPHG
jgi:hypothetical protein